MVIPIQSLALESKPVDNTGIFLNYSSSKKLVTDLKFYDTNYPIMEKKYNLCSDQLNNSNKEITVTNQLLDGCNKDKVDLTTVSKKFEKKYSDTDKLLSKCESSKPSRLTWFTIGGAVVGILATVLAVSFARR